MIRALLACCGVAAATTFGLSAAQEPPTIEAACESAQSRIGSLTVRVPWTPVRTDGGAEVQFCVLRGSAQARLDFERNAEIVQFAVLGRDGANGRRSYRFEVRTNQGRVLRQGPSSIQAGAGFRRSCSAAVCQFFTEPGEFVSGVAVEVE